MQFNPLDEKKIFLAPERSSQQYHTMGKHKKPPAVDIAAGGEILIGNCVRSVFAGQVFKHFQVADTHPLPPALNDTAGLHLAHHTADGFRRS